MYLEKKRDGRIKDRGCADGKPEQEYTDKIDTPSLTALVVIILLTCMIDAFKRRDVATVDITGAFFCGPRCPKEKMTYTAYWMAEWLKNCT